MRAPAACLMIKMKKWWWRDSSMMSGQQVWYERWREKGRYSQAIRMKGWQRFPIRCHIWQIVPTHRKESRRFTAFSSFCEKKTWWSRHNSWPSVYFLSALDSFKSEYQLEAAQSNIETKVDSWVNLPRWLKTLVCGCDHKTSQVIWFKGKKVHLKFFGLLGVSSGPSTLEITMIWLRSRRERTMSSLSVVSLTLMEKVVADDFKKWYKSWTTKTLPVPWWTPRENKLLYHGIRLPICSFFVGRFSPRTYMSKEDIEKLKEIIEKGAQTWEENENYSGYLSLFVCTNLWLQE